MITLLKQWIWNTICNNFLFRRYL